RAAWGRDSGCACRLAQSRYASFCGEELQRAAKEPAQAREPTSSTKCTSAAGCYPGLAAPSFGARRASARARLDHAPRLGEATCSDRDGLAIGRLPMDG